MLARRRRVVAVDRPRSQGVTRAIVGDGGGRGGTTFLRPPECGPLFSAYRTSETGLQGRYQAVHHVDAVAICVRRTLAPALGANGVEIAWCRFRIRKRIEFFAANMIDVKPAVRVVRRISSRADNQAILFHGHPASYNICFNTRVTIENSQGAGQIPSRLKDRSHPVIRANAVQY